MGNLVTLYTASCQILRRVASAAHRKAVGASIPPEVGSYSPQQGKGSHGQSNGQR